VDSGVVEGTEISVNYDPLLAKLIVSAESRDAAIARAAAALRAYPVLGIRSNVPFLLSLLDLPAFKSGQLHTGFVDEHLSDLLADTPPTAPVLAAAALADGPRSDLRSLNPLDTRHDPWSAGTRWGR
jgi:acetyl/propionyl-CoA carboxylase alpha subunit